MTTPLILIAALFVLAGGYVHLREWQDTYRALPAIVPGRDVVRIGFPINAAVSLVLALALLVTTVRFRRLAPLVLAGAMVFEAASLAAVVISRNASLFGWMESTWTLGANQSVALEIGALVNLALVIAIATVHRRAPQPVLVAAAS
ncbi:MAG: hypothetical protein M3159_02405 [Actinomycetota bacterium]|nr:hypothetical protein [Actinomycetota bacterium]